MTLKDGIKLMKVKAGLRRHGIFPPKPLVLSRQQSHPLILQKYIYMCRLMILTREGCKART